MIRKLSFLLVILALIFAVSGCVWKKAGDENSSSSPNNLSPGGKGSTVSVTDKDLAEAKNNVENYLKMMEDGKYEESYAHLSSESKEMHSLLEFTKDIKQGMPQLDFSIIETKKTKKGILVSISFYEDPSAAGYNLIKENGDWVIVYRGGSPAMPTDIEVGNENNEKGDPK